MNRFLICISCLFCCCATQVLAQSVVIQKQFVASSTTQSDTFASFIAANQHINQIIPNLQKQGYLAASIDSFQFEKDLYTLHIYKGSIYKWAKVNLVNFPNALKQNIEKKYPKLQTKIIDPEQLSDINNDILRYAEAEGAPFAYTRLENVQLINDTNIAADLVFYADRKYNIDSIKIHYNGLLDKQFMLHYLDLREGMQYDIKKLNQIDRYLNGLPYLQKEKDWDVYFGMDKTQLNIYLKEQKANRANAIIGIQPSNDDNRRFQTTADAMLKLYNALGYGENFSLTYQQLQYRSPKLKVTGSWPYILDTKFGIDASFELYQLDTTFRKTKLNIGINYKLTSTDVFQIYTEIQSNRIIAFDTTYVVQNMQLPPNIDVKTTGLGAMISINRTNHLYNPTKGLMTNISILANDRKVLKNNAIDEISNTTDYSYLYDSISDDNLQIRLLTNVEYYLPLTRFITIKTAYNNGYISGSNLFRNELYQIGGYKLLRGFDEESIFTKQYHLGTIEPRFIIGAQSFVGAFFDFGWLSSINANGGYENYGVKSLGINSSFNTKSGLFNIALATSSIGDQALKFSNMRVHFGYSIYF